ncbi:MAG: hypothetical protein H8D45_24485 [Bacteroidetes bacterium]|nr:hypothetical protein [Bacteroidota bacterium]MBL7104421.1 hypothetical protein [Bacteroidales bacterium]
MKNKSKFDLGRLNEVKIFKKSIIVLLILIIAYTLILFLFIDKFESRGQFGDSFGMMTSIFSGIAVILLIFTLIIQKKEYKQTLIEFSKSSDAQDKAQIALNAQLKTLKIQQFESTFFNILNLIHEASDRINTFIYLSDDPNDLNYEIEAKGIDFFSAIIQAMEFIEFHQKRDFNMFIRSHYLNDTKNIIEIQKNKPVQYFRWKYEFLFSQYGQYLGHYCRMVYHLFKLTFQNFNDDETRKKYLSILEASLSNDQLSVLFYNGISKHAHDSHRRSKFFHWMNYYNFLENIAEESLVFRDHFKFYPFVAFKFLNSKEKEFVNQFRESNINNIEEYIKMI